MICHFLRNTERAEGLEKDVSSHKLTVCCLLCTALCCGLWVQVSVDSERLGPSVLPPLSNVTLLASHWLAAPRPRL